MSGVNTLARRVATKSIYPDATALVSTAISFAQGDLIFFDDTNNLIKKVTAEADGATILGVAPVTIVSGKFPSIYNTAVDASVAIPHVPGPEYGDVHRMVLKAGDAINPGDKVYIDAANLGRGVTITGTKAIGIYQGKALTAATGGTEIEVLIGTRVPDDTLKF
jgi:Uncharacterized conserved protein (DUF2190)